MRDLFIGWLEKLITVIVVLMILAVIVIAVIVVSSPAGGLLHGLFTLVAGGLYVVLMGGLMYLFLGIYHNTKRTAELLAARNA